jgi:hypothetical protein
MSQSVETDQPSFIHWIPSVNDSLWTPRKRRNGPVIGRIAGAVPGTVGRRRCWWRGGLFLLEKGHAKRFDWVGFSTEVATDDEVDCDMVRSRMIKIGNSGE